MRLFTLTDKYISEIEASQQANKATASQDLSSKFSHLQQEFSDSEDEEETIKRVLKQVITNVGSMLMCAATTDT